ncbi:hypothetical protein SY27_15905 [Flavobacterium sp. 316]|uniref:hypothetical protein n=1 Tax=Flavobacterium sp. 316 TaxID=1603293 RepID=UPI0005E763BF|nr:hypothetical protein [Flavobacterium sp. 316]KIX20001.1 hypothetical protein SY27_15905 [Flavobacterium sp. 316]
MKKRRKYYNSKVFLFASILTIFLVSSYSLFSNKTFQYCSNENYLLGIHDSLPVIEINYNNYRNDILEEIAIKLKKETCCELNEFLLKLSTNETVNVTLFNYCKSCDVICGNKSFTRILLNRDNQLLVNERPIENDSLTNYLHNLLKKPDTDYNYVENCMLYWDLTTDKDYIEKTFIAIKKSYQLYYEEMALQKFGKQICELAQKELEEIKRKELSIYLGVGNRIFEPLPPPPPPNKQNYGNK